MRVRESIREQLYRCISGRHILRENRALPRVAWKISVTLNSVHFGTAVCEKGNLVEQRRIPRVFCGNRGDRSSLLPTGGEVRGGSDAAGDDGID